jgi:hypothetical protein
MEKNLASKTAEKTSLSTILEQSYDLMNQAIEIKSSLFNALSLLNPSDVLREGEKTIESASKQQEPNLAELGYVAALRISLRDIGYVLREITQSAQEINSNIK